MREEELIVGDFERARVERASLRIACAGEADLPSIVKLGWLLGRRTELVLPWAIETHAYADLEEGLPSDGETYVVDDRLLQWRRKLAQELEEDAPVLLPAWSRRRSVYSDFGGNFGGNDRVDDYQHLLDGAVVASDVLGLPSTAFLQLDLPALLIDNHVLLRKVMRDYPVASMSLRNLVCEAYRVIRERVGDAPVNADGTAVLRSLLNDVVAPAVRRIEEEKRGLLKLQTVRSGTRLITLAIPLLVALPSSWREIVTTLASLDAARVVGDEIIEAVAATPRSRDPGFAALRMGFSACAS